MTDHTPDPKVGQARPSALAQITVRLETPPEYRGTEIIADLRGVAETLFYPFKAVGFWDGQTGNHLCPMAEAGNACPHSPEAGGRSAYAVTVEDALAAEMEVLFPHADLWVYLG